MEMTATTIGQLRELLGKTPPFSESSSDELDDLVSNLSIADYPPGVVIVKKGQTEHPYLYLLVSGDVRLTETITSGETRTFGEGKLLGHFGLLPSGALPYQVLSGDEKLAEQWLASWAECANQSLDQIDLSLCAGNMMAGNPVWRLPAQQWGVSSFTNGWKVRKQIR